MLYEYDVAVIGGGPAGLAAAKEAGALGAKTALISAEPPGGRALWHSLVPSKVWLYAAENSAKTLRHELPELLERLQLLKHQQHKQDAAELQRLGVQRVAGAAAFKDAHTLEIKTDSSEQTLTAGHIIIATGSVPVFPSGLKPDGDRVIAPRLMSKLESIPESIIVVGGGVTGSEMIHLFNRLGSNVTAVTDMTELLPRSAPVVSQALEANFRDRGVTLHKNVRAESVENTGNGVVVTLADGRRTEADYAFVAIGRKPDLQNLKLQNAGVETQDNRIVVDGGSQTSVQSIYAIGDSTGAPMTANRAMTMGRQAARHAVNGTNDTYHPEWSVEAVYTEPEVAQVGDVSENDRVAVYRAEYTANLKAAITDHQYGFINVWADKSTNKIRGAAGIGRHVADVMAIVAVALRGGLTLNDLQTVSPPNPTFSELLWQLKLEK